MRCFVCASTHGLKLFEFEFEWCTVRLGDSPQTLLPTTYSPTSTENLPRPHSLSSVFFFLLLLLRPFFLPSHSTAAPSPPSQVKSSAQPLSAYSSSFLVQLVLFFFCFFFPRSDPLTSLAFSVRPLSTFLWSLCLCQAACFLGPASLNPPQGLPASRKSFFF